MSSENAETGQTINSAVEQTAEVAPQSSPSNSLTTPSSKKGNLVKSPNGVNTSPRSSNLTLRSGWISTSSASKKQTMVIDIETLHSVEELNQLIKKEEEAKKEAVENEGFFVLTVIYKSIYQFYLQIT
jgi:hypothetical protein